jgi:hypothetical protein
MTAELFIKLTATLFARRRRGLANSNSDNSDVDSSCDDDDMGGVTLNVPDTNGGFFPDSNSSGEAHLPPTWHAMQLNRFAVLVDGEEDNTSIKTSAVKPASFMPSMKNSFWNAYVNKLRVTAAEGGTCDLAVDD